MIHNPETILLGSITIILIWGLILLWNKLDDIHDDIKKDK